MVQIYKPVISWTGTKFNFALELIKKYVPRFEKINTCLEPFLGGGGFLSAGLFRFGNYFASDWYKPLIDIWKLIQLDPDELINSYSEWDSTLRVEGKPHYYNLRETYNKQTKKDPSLFFTLIHHAYHSLIRFNSKGEFNSPYGFERRPSQPHNISRIIMEWNKYIQDINFTVLDYRDTLHYVEMGDFVFLDPPYESTVGSNVYGNNQDAKVTPEDVYNYIESVDERGAFFCLTYDYDYADPQFFKYKISYVNQYKQIKKSESTDSFYYVYSNYPRQKPEQKALC